MAFTIDDTYNYIPQEMQTRLETYSDLTTWEDSTGATLTFYQHQVQSSIVYPALCVDEDIQVIEYKGQNARATKYDIPLVILGLVQVYKSVARVDIRELLVLLEEICRTEQDGHWGNLFDEIYTLSGMLFPTFTRKGDPLFGCEIKLRGVIKKRYTG